MRDQQLTWLGLIAVGVFSCALIFGLVYGQKGHSDGQFYALAVSSGPGLVLFGKVQRQHSGAHVTNTEAMNCEIVMKLPIAEIGYSCSRMPALKRLKQRIADLQG